MKNLRLLLFIIFTFTTLFLGSCKKNDNSVSGVITYVGAVSGIEYKASGAVVYLMVNNTDYIEKTTTDADGAYVFYPVDDGEYHIEAEVTVNLIDYDGKSSNFTILGDDDETIDLILY